MALNLTAQWEISFGHGEWFLTDFNAFDNFTIL